MSVIFYSSRRRTTGWLFAAAAGLLLTGCSKGTSAGKVVAMGDEVAVGSLIYTITQTTWAEQLDGQSGLRIPTNKFLMVHATVRNAGRTSAGVPLLSLVDASGKEYMELDKGEGVPQWLGALRNLPEGSTESGNLLFDVPQGAYKIRVASGGDVEKETTALVDLPYSVEPVKVTAPDTLPTPPGK